MNPTVAYSLYPTYEENLDYGSVLEETNPPPANPTVAYSFYPTHEEILDYGSVIEETNPPPKNHEISVHYASLDDFGVEMSDYR